LSSGQHHLNHHKDASPDTATYYNFWVFPEEKEKGKKGEEKTSILSDLKILSLINPFTFFFGSTGV
jgi:hypothetical protein